MVAQKTGHEKSENKGPQIPEDKATADPDLSYTRNIWNVIAAERAAIEARKNFVSEQSGSEDGKDDTKTEELEIDIYTPCYNGLAISGGGIRSASFAIGAIQCMQHHKMLGNFEYMSTVSGGGYAGGSLTWFLSNYEQKLQKEMGDDAAKDIGLAARFFGSETFGLDQTNFPFHDKTEGTLPLQEDKEKRVSKRNIVDFIRQRSSYMQPGEGLSTISAVSVVFRSMLTSITAFTAMFTILFAFIVLVMALITAFLSPVMPDDPLLAYISAKTSGDFGLSEFFFFGGGLFGATAFLWLLYSGFTAVPMSTKSAYFFRREIEKYGGGAVQITVVLMFLGCMDQLYMWFSAEGFSFSYIMSSSVVGVIGGFISRKLLSDNGGAMHPMLFSAITTISAILVMAGFGMISVFLGYEMLELLDDPALWVLVPVTITLSIIYCAFANINLSGLHRLYRDRLMETFMPNRRSVMDDQTTMPAVSDLARLHNFFEPDAQGPFHIINTNIVLRQAKKARFRSRGGDSFMLSPLFSGSEATGWIKSRDWLWFKGSDKKRKWWNRYFIKPVYSMTLPTAVAISGAALNPRTGADGRGPTKKFTLSFLLNFLNLRLGYWIPNPDPDRQTTGEGASGDMSSASTKLLRSKIFPPNFFFPGLFQGLLGTKDESRSGWVELSDGGHFDNCGLYELFRRRTKTILLLDGSADPGSDFVSFSNSLEKAYIDTGVIVDFHDDAKYDPETSFSFQNMVQGTGIGKKDLISQRQNFSRYGFAVGEITYPDKNGVRKPAKGDDRCFLFYVKTSMVTGLPAKLYSYKAANSSFPDEPTSDQYFSEQQFEAYRILGYYLLEQMVRHIRHFKPLASALGIKPAAKAKETWPVKRQEKTQVRQP